MWIASQTSGRGKLPEYSHNSNNSQYSKKNNSHQLIISYFHMFVNMNFYATIWISYSFMQCIYMNIYTQHYINILNINIQKSLTFIGIVWYNVFNGTEHVPKKFRNGRCTKMKKYTYSKQQQNEMKFALKMFGVTREHDNETIHHVTTDTDIINELLMCYDMNDYGFSKHEYDTEIESMYEFLFDYNDREMNGVDENFSFVHEQLNRKK